MPVAVLVTLTVTAGTAAPVESVTVPVIVPRMVCAAAGPARLQARSTPATKPVHCIRRACFIVGLLQTSCAHGRGLESRMVSAYVLTCQWRFAGERYDA